MPLNPQDIVRKEFREALRGYNQADVDLFLDEVVEEFTRVAEDNQKMKVRIAALQQEVARLREGRGGAPAAAAAGGGGDPQRVEAEVRARPPFPGGADPADRIRDPLGDRRKD